MPTQAELTNARLRLVNQALFLLDRIMAGNPAPSDRRDLDHSILDLTKAQTKLEGLLEAQRRTPSVTPPDSALFDETQRLTSEVEAAIRSTTTARDAIVVSTRILTAVEKTRLA